MVPILGWVVKREMQACTGGADRRIQELKRIGTNHLEQPDIEVQVSRSGWQAILARRSQRPRPVYPPEQEIQAMRRERAAEHAEQLAKVKARGQAIVEICRRSAERRGKKRN